MLDEPGVRSGQRERCRREIRIPRALPLQADRRESETGGGVRLSQAGKGSIQRHVACSEVAQPPRRAKARAVLHLDPGDATRVRRDPDRRVLADRPRIPDVPDHAEGPIGQRVEDRPDRFRANVVIVGLDRERHIERPDALEKLGDGVDGAARQRLGWTVIVPLAEEQADGRCPEVARELGVCRRIRDRRPHDTGVAADEVRIRGHGDGAKTGCGQGATQGTASVGGPVRPHGALRSAAPLDSVPAARSRLLDDRLGVPFRTGEGAERQTRTARPGHLDIIRLTTYGRAVVEGGGAVAERVEALVIGGGVVGCAVLLELALRGVDAVLLEAENDIGEGTSKANSAILHTGFDAKPGTLEATLLRRSAERWSGLLEDLGVPSLTCGALMLARTAEEAARLEDYVALARSHGVAVELVDGSWLRDEAPYVASDAVGAMHIPDEGIVDPFWLTRAYAEAAIALGSRVRTRARVVGLSVDGDAVTVTLADGDTFRAEQAFDCAGLRADEIAALAGDTSFSITPRKGEFLVSELTGGVDRIVLPIPGPLGKGMLVTPIVFGGVLLGPTAVDGTDKSDRSTTEAGRERILESCRALVPAVDEMTPIRSFAGVRPVSSTGEYVIRPSTAGDRLTIVAGIRSTGISASPGIAEAAVEVAARSRRWGMRRPGVRPTAPSPELAPESGPIICVCRSVGEAEVVAALTGATPVTTTDALKRRCGVGFGDCQGNRCAAEAIGRIAHTAGIAPEAVEKGPVGSWIVAASTAAPPPDARSDSSAGALTASRAADVIVVGGGLAGIAAGLALLDAGLAVRVIDRGPSPGGAVRGIDPDLWTADERSAIERARRLAVDGELEWTAGATVVALDRDGTDWHLEVASPIGSETAGCRHVVLATGGYITPREHSAIDGPRPSGVMTADFVVDALDRGWRPARRAIVVGDGRIASGVSARLRTAGVEVETTGGAAPGDGRAVTAVRGQPRLEAAEIGGAWHPADALILADRLQPANFLLRGFGLGDERPGIPAPVDADGALPMSGLWAAGTCVAPDVDHVRSLADGLAVAQALLATVERTAAASTPTGA